LESVAISSTTAQEHVETERARGRAQGLSTPLPDLEKPVRGAARRGQTEQAGANLHSRGNARPGRARAPGRRSKRRDSSRRQNRWRTALRSRGQCASEPPSRSFLRHQTGAGFRDSVGRRSFRRPAPRVAATPRGASPCTPSPSATRPPPARARSSWRPTRAPGSPVRLPPGASRRRGACSRCCPVPAQEPRSRCSRRARSRCGRSLTRDAGRLDPYPPRAGGVTTVAAPPARGRDLTILGQLAFRGCVMSKQALGNALAGVAFLVIAIVDFTRDSSGVGVVFLVFAAVFFGLALSGRKGQ